MPPSITPPAGCDLVLKTDGIVGGVHFFPDDPPDTVARKALRVNLSDLAAKGARPLGFLLTLALPKEIDDAWLAPFARGLGADADASVARCWAATPTARRDRSRFRSPSSATVPHGKMVRRAGATPGDRVVVTGTIGDAALGLLLRRDRSAAARWGLDRRPAGSPAGPAISCRSRAPPSPKSLGGHASAAMDVSDGLAGDLAKLCRASGVAADIEVARVPLSDAARAALAQEPALIEADPHRRRRL